MTKRKRSKRVNWEKKYKAEVRKRKRFQTKLVTELTYKALELRKDGVTWVKIGKKLHVPESSIRLATQRKFDKDFLRGRVSKKKKKVGAVMEERTRALLKKGGFSPTTGKRIKPNEFSYEEYVRQAY